MLEESIGDHGHQRVAMKPLPGSPLEVIETEFLVHLLVRLFTHTARLDGWGEHGEVGIGRQVREIVLSLTRETMLANEPGLLTGQMLLALVPDPLRRAVGDTDADRCELRPQRSLGAGAPADLCPDRIRNDSLGRDRQHVGNRVLARTATPGDGTTRLVSGNDALTFSSNVASTKVLPCSGGPVQWVWRASCRSASIEAPTARGDP